MADYYEKTKRALRKKGINVETGKFASDTNVYWAKRGKTGYTKIVYPFKSKEEAEEYFLGKDPKKTKYYKQYGGKN